MAQTIYEPMRAHLPYRPDADTDAKHGGKNVSQILQGILFCVAGVVAIVMYSTTAFAAEFLVGGVLMVSGFMQLGTSARYRMDWWLFASGLLSAVVGVLMMAYPYTGLTALILAVMGFLTVSGFVELATAYESWPENHAKWAMASGLLALVLAALLWVDFPTFGVLYIGWIVGLNLIFCGVSLLTEKKEASDVALY